VKAKDHGQIKMVQAKKVDYVYLDPKSFFSVTTNAIPFLSSNHANRGMMADRHIEQAVPLVNPESPLVQSRFEGKEGYEGFFGRYSNVQSPVDGKVRKILKDKIEIVGTDRKVHEVPLHANYPLNGGVFLNDTPTVKAGDKVSKGQLVANNNFTKDGELALGKNFRMALLPFRGWNFEDAVVISEGAAKKLTSEHMHDVSLAITPSVKVGLDRWLAHFPDKAESVDRAKYDTDGIIKKGATISRGEVVIPAVEESQPHEEYDYAKLHKSLTAPWRNTAVEWESDYSGQVIEVVKTAKFIRVLIKTNEPAQIGDKVSNRSGGKGIVSNIIPDNEMYQDAKGNVIDLLYNPAGIGGRVIPGLMLEGAAGKIAEKTGKTYLVDSFDTSVAADDKIRKELKGLGLSDVEQIFDPVANKKLDDIFVGKIHVMKLQHQVRKKFNTRGIEGYSGDAQPTKITGESAQNLGSQELYALMASGATHFLQDASTLKSSSNPEYWRALQLGLPLPPARQPFILDKFVASLNQAGINLKQDGNNLKALPLTDKDTKSWSKGEIENPMVIRANDLRPEVGGLFDKTVTGGYDGMNWAHIKLESTMPSPLMEKPIASLTGIKSSEFSAIMNGSLYVTPGGEFTADFTKGKSHGEGLKVLLSRVDVNRDLKDTLAKIRSAKGSSLNELNKKRRFLQALKAIDLSPGEAYLQTLVPVVPPKFRPIYPLPDGSLNVSDANHAYREVLMINNQLKDLKKLGVDDKNLARLRSDLYGAMQGLAGVEEPLTRSKDFKGAIATIKGRVNKTGLFQGRTVRRPQDLSARSTAIPDPKLGIDEIGIPASMGLVIYKPFLVRRLVGAGFSPKDAADLVEKGDEKAVAMLVEEMKERPVYMNRAPSLHKFNMLPFLPRLVQGQAITTNPLITSGYNLDYDGDTIGIHVPASEEARKEAFDKLPSKQIFSVRDTRLMHLPSAETSLGIYLMTFPKGTPVKAASVKDMLSLLQQKKIKINTPVVIAGKTWTAGQALVNDLFPAGMKPGSGVLDRKTAESLLYETARKHPKEIGDIVSKIKDLGNYYVTDIGFSVGLADLLIDRKERDKILKEATRKTGTVGFDVAHAEALGKITKLVKGTENNRFVIGSMTSGAFGKSGGVGQMLGAPVAVTDHKGRTIQVQIPRSYAEGQDIASYWAALPGARRGMVQKGLGTQEVGALSKRLLNTTVNVIISEADCGTTDGIVLPIESREATDRVIAEGPNRGKIVDPAIVRALKGRGAKTIKVRSPLKCRAVKGICARCFGLMENGQFPPVGYHIGVLAGQAVSEPATQTMLRQFHTQGVVGQKTVGFDRIEQLFEMPDNVKGSAPLAKLTGKVTDVRPSAAGGWFVDIGAAEHFIPKELGLAVKKGETVRAGQRLSQGGIIKPQELLATTGDIHKVREQIINDLDEQFQSGGIRVKRRLFETVVKPMTDRAEVTDAGDGEKYGIYRGEVVSVNQIEEVNKKIRKAKGVPIKFMPTLLSIGVAPYHGDDFIGKLMFERLHETLIAAPAIGSSVDIKTGHPITKFVFGKYVVGAK
jgi:DNA-directed RNA polymerase subunit beta'